MVLKDDFFSEIISIIKNKKIKKEELHKIKVKLCLKYKISKIPTDIEILLHAKPSDAEELHLVTKPGRTGSGVTVIAIMSYPFSCPHGKCIICPGGPASFFGDVPQSYTGKEPATLRAIRNDFDPYLQVFNRLEQYIATNHNLDKIELIVMGGTFPSFKKKYQKNFIMYSLKAMNDFGEFFFDSNNNLLFDKYKEFFEMPGSLNDKERIERVKKRIMVLKGKSSIGKEQERNSCAKVRCVAMCIETRPDFCSEKHVRNMIALGCTRLEIGVQSIDDAVLKKINRGHNVSDLIKATETAKEHFLKVGYHIMPGLPGSTKKKDIETFKELFEKDDFRPDALKIYPCMVIEGTKLFDIWKKGEYKPLSTTGAVEIIIKGKKFVPNYCRIMRIQRDIPTHVISAGVDKTNLRQYVEEEMKKKGLSCRCIRCREPRGRIVLDKNLKMVRTDYKASHGIEIFLSLEDTINDIIVGFLRLRVNKDSKTAGVRELHVYGDAVKIGETGLIQHKGFGKRLIKEAEDIVKEEFKIKKLFIISGIGVRRYYEKLGYKKELPYMTKSF